MTAQQFFSRKSETKKHILKKLKITGKPKALGFICADLELDSDFLQWIETLGADFVIMTPQDTVYKNIYNLTKEEIYSQLEWYDFFLCSNTSESLKPILDAGVVPIIYQKNSLSSLLQDFNPMKWEGNSFLYQEENKWNIFATLVKYLENYKFPYDNKNLVKNILEM